MSMTFVATLVAWVFFRSPSLSSALNQLGHMTIHPVLHGANLDSRWTVILMMYVVVMLVVEWVQRDRPHGLAIGDQPVLVRWFVYLSVTLGILFLGNFGELQFIYFQF